jgi:hypothetical protein
MREAKFFQAFNFGYLLFEYESSRYFIHKSVEFLIPANNNAQ